MDKISSVHNARIKNLKKLEKASERKLQNRLLIEGLRETVLAHRAGYIIESLYVCSDILKTEGDYSLTEILNTIPKAEVFQVTEDVYRSIAYRDSTEGILSVAFSKNLTLQNIKLTEQPLILVIEGVEKPGNFGAMLRTADAAGVTAVIICDGKTDVYNANVIRSSVGTVFTNQIAVCETAEAIAYLKENNITTYAAELSATECYFQKNFRQPAAVIVGTEATGLSRTWINAAEERIKIPMLGKIDSLNVSVSAAVLLFEAIRQRHNA